MFGGHSFGDVGFSDERVNSSLVLFFGFNLSIDLEYRIYVASSEFIDVETGRPYSDALDEPLDFTWSMANGAAFGGFITGRGVTVINNLDRRFDRLTQRYTTDARPVEVRLGRKGTPQSSWPIVFLGLSSGEFIDDATFEITDEDNGYKLDVPLQSVVFAGTGDLEGNADLAGKPQPLCYGWTLNIEAPLVIPNELLYRVHYGPVQAISAVYDKGFALTFYQNFATVALLRAATIPGGQYGTCLAQGYFRLAFDVTQDGAVTADVQGGTTYGFAETSVQIIKAIVRSSTALAYPDDLYMPSFDVVEAEQAAPIGVYISHNQNPTVAAVVGEIVSAIDGFVGFRRDSKLQIGLIQQPLGPPVKRFDKYKFDPNPQKQKLPDGIWPPPWKWLVGYQKNYTVMTDPAGGVSEDRRSFLAAEYRFASAEASAVKVDHPFGKDPAPVQGFFRDQADAVAEATKRLALYRRSMGLYSFGISDRDAALLNIGDQVFVKHERGDLTVGRYMMIVSLQHKASSGSATLQGFG